MSDELLAMGQRIMGQQAFSQHLGAELTALEPGLARLEVEIADHHRQQHGFVHGGVIAYLADNALTYAGGSKFGDALTVEFKINYARPARSGRLVAEARVVHAGRRLALCECSVHVVEDGESLLVAKAQGTIARVGKETD